MCKHSFIQDGILCGWENNTILSDRSKKVSEIVLLDEINESQISNKNRLLR